MSQILNTLGPI